MNGVQWLEHMIKAEYRLETAKTESEKEEAKAEVKSLNRYALMQTLFAIVLMGLLFAIPAFADTDLKFGDKVMVKAPHYDSDSKFYDGLVGVVIDHEEWPACTSGHVYTIKIKRNGVETELRECSEHFKKVMTY